MRIDKTKLKKFRLYATGGRVVAFDTETTGCSRYDEICQIAAAEYACGELTRTFSAYICPTCEINPQAESVHGLSIDFLSENGLTPEDAIRRFFEFLGNDALLVAHNNKFDMRMLNQECEKFGLCFAPNGIKTCDTLALARHLLPNLDCHALSRLIDVLGIDGANSHDALDDAQACANLFFRLIGESRYPCGKLVKQFQEIACPRVPLAAESEF